ncbi:DUF1990 family protein [Nocardioides sp.]|uniref:DUF1990 family protein n=1 Tax=Nocardioides sp. TaxID=35761 RepID=UPI003510F0D7
MPVTTLDDATTARLREAPFTYEAVGALAATPAPALVDDARPPRTSDLPHLPGFHSFERSAQLRRRDFDGAAADLLGWKVQAGAGLRVAASESPLREGTVVLLRLGPGPLALRIPCRVVAVIDEPDRRGFVYGTLPGHPERGEERFVLERSPDGTITFHVAAFSRPATALARLGGPAGRAFQRFMTTRYLRALDA